MSGPVSRALAAEIAEGRLADDPDQHRVAGALDDLVQRLSVVPWLGPPPRVRGLYLYGGVGRGKSMLMDLFVQTLASLPGRRGVERVHFHEFMQRVHALVIRHRAGQTGDPVGKAADDIARGVRVLAFDELQVTDIADAMIIGRLFERLFERRVTIVSTSNRHPAELYRNGLNRQLFLPFIAMIQYRMEVVALDGAHDWRLDRLLAAPVWHAPLGWKAERAMQDAWARLTGAAQTVAQEIRVGSRVWTAPQTAAGCARLGFAALCDTALGAADYLELTRRFHTLLVDDIPRLTPDRRDAARRFVTLIDTLYEARTKLIASAAAEPAALYPEGDGAFEFERTVSRLMEMRSVDYLSAPRTEPADPAPDGETA